MKHSKGVRFHLCFCQLVCHCPHFCIFPSFSYFKSRQTMLKGNSRGIQAPQGAQLRLLYKNVSEVVAACTKHVLAFCRHSFQSCPTASIPWFYVALIMNVLAGWFFPSDYFLKWRYFCSNLVPIFSHNAVYCYVAPLGIDTIIMLAYFLHYLPRKA